MLGSSGFLCVTTKPACTTAPECYIQLTSDAPCSCSPHSPGELYQEGAERLRALMAALPEVAANESLLGALLGTNPALAMVDPQEVSKTRRFSHSESMGLDAGLRTLARALAWGL